MDPIAIGQKIKQTYPQYAHVDDATLGQKYMSRYGGAISAVKSGQMKVTDLPVSGQIGTAAFSDVTGIKSPLSATQQAADDTKKELGSNASLVISVLDAGKTGKLKGQAYKDALDFASSKYAASAGFGQGGKALTEPELTILGGSIPVIQQQGANLLQKAMGIVPPQRGHVVDDEETLRRKAQMAMAIANGQNPDLSMLSGANNAQTNPPTGAVGGLLKNALTNAKDIGNTVVNGAVSAAKDPVNTTAYSPQNIMPYLLTNPNQAVKAANAVAGGVNGVANSLNQTLGRPLEGGDVLGRAGTHAYERPIDTAMWLLPAIKALRGGEGSNASQAAGGATSTGAGLLPKIGAGLRQGVNDIQLPPSIYGASKEAAVNATLDNLGLTGSAAQKYTQLQPKMSQLGDQIQASLEQNPKQIPIQAIRDDFMTNLADQMRTSQLDSKTAQKEVSGYISSLYGDKLGTTIDTPTLFKLKQQINKDYQGVANKLERGSPLNDREKVISAARQTIDDLLANAHPDVKEATVMQSQLYDAAESLAKSRNKSTRLPLPFGFRLPLPTEKIQRAQDLLGRTLQGK